MSRSRIASVTPMAIPTETETRTRRRRLVNKKKTTQNIGVYGVQVSVNVVILTKKKSQSPEALAKTYVFLSQKSPSHSEGHLRSGTSRYLNVSHHFPHSRLLFTAWECVLHAQSHVVIKVAGAPILTLTRWRHGGRRLEA